MTSLEDIVNGVKDGWFVGDCVECTFSTSKAGQRFAILITKGVWYALRVIMDEDYRQYSQARLSTVYVGPEWLIRKEYLTKEGALAAATNYRRKLETGKFLEIYKELSPNAALPRKRVMPSECVKNPDHYLKPGDLLQTNFVLNSNHEGIYIGNGKVIHVSGHGEGKSGSVARVGTLLGDFVDNERATVRVVVYPVSFQKPTEIVKMAQDFANSKFREGEYNLLVQNCQHFARLCVVGRGECGDLQTMFSALQNLTIAGYMGYLALLA